MAANLPGDICIGAYNACILRAAKLDADCSPLGGANSGIVTAALVDMTASPEIEEGTVFEPKNGCGDIGFTVAEDDKIKRYNLSGNMLFWDPEMFALLFEGTLITAHATNSDLETGSSIGYADRVYTNTTRRKGVYLEVITLAASQGSGDCVAAVSGAPYAIGHIFGKAKLTPGDKAFGNDVVQVAFSGKSFSNPSLYNGPWNDWPGNISGSPYIPNTPYTWVGYSEAEYTAIADLIHCGYSANLPTGS